MDGWMDVCMHGCMYGCMYVCIYVAKIISQKQQTHNEKHERKEIATSKPKQKSSMEILFVFCSRRSGGPINQERMSYIFIKRENLVYKFCRYLRVAKMESRTKLNRMNVRTLR